MLTADPRGRRTPLPDNATLTAGVEGLPAPDISRMLAISTSHLPKRLGKSLDEIVGVWAQAIEGGWLIYVPHTWEEYVYPLDLLRVLDFARRHDCRWVHLHSDNGIEPSLPTWDW
jgi:hypothetical protein